MRLKSALGAALLATASTLVTISPALAATVTATGTNPAVCNQEVGNSANVTAVRLAGGDCVVQFRNVGSTTWTVPAGVTSVSSLVIGGGGGGGFGSLGGGGGAGEVLISGITTLSSGVVSGFSAISVTPAALTTIVIGSGGISGAPTGATATSANWANQSGSATKGGNGGSTSFGSVTADGGGGGGGSTPNINGQRGGSGGGSAASGTGGAVDASGVTGWSSYKNVGETSGGNSGGGGAGGAGGLPSSTRGGAGISVSITGTSVKYAGGGGGWGALGAENNLEDATLGGNGRLTTGAWPYAGSSNHTSPGAANTGTGGGAGAPGGSGIVIIRYNPDTTAPSFTNGTSFSFAENTAITTNAATITVSESSTVSLNASGDHLLFTVVTSDSTTARIRFLSIPNFESPLDSGGNNVYDLSVRATDTAGNAASQSITITVTNVNEAPTITTASSAATHAISQAENISTVLTYTGSDVDTGTTLTWSISGTDAAFFTINSSSGVLTFISAPDFESAQDDGANNSYIVTITLSDGALIDTQNLTVTITNANESASINTPTTSGAINKGIATTISVTVNTAGKVRFFVGGKRINSCLARTTSGSYPTFTATCTWRPAVTGRQSLTATVTPTDNTFSASTSARSEVFVLKRGTTR